MLVAKTPAMVSLMRALLLIFVLFVGCSKDPQPDPDPSPDMSVDVSPDAAEPDMGQDAGDMPPDAGGSCAVQDDCAVDQACVDGACRQVPGCNDVNDWKICVRELAAFGGDYALRAFCGEAGYCRVACLEDGECRDGEVCTDYGYCREFAGDLTAPAPGGGDRAALRAGVSNVRMKFPIGISMAGYGSRVDRSEKRYADVISSSIGHFHALYGRAVWLDNGEREVVIVRLPIIFASAWLHEAVARRLQEETGENWRDSLIISTTHSHSGPARFWPLAEDAALDVGRLGSDTYSHVAFEWIVDSAVEAALAARENMQPAQFGWTIVEAYDTDDAIASDRWGETPPFDDNRLLMLRVDDMNGTPLAGAISLGIHSTYNDSDYLTGDAAGALERQLELEFGRRYGQFVPVMFLSENGGTMSPRGGHRGHESLHQHEFLGFEFTRRTIDAFDAIETSDDIELGAQTHTFPISYERVGYEVGEWVRGNASTHEDTWFHGAIQCLANTDEDPATHADEFNYICLPVHFMSQNRPASVFTRSVISALNLNGLTVVTLPGESSMEVGWQVLREARDRLGVDPASAFVWGYAQDHQLYITPTNLRGELPSFPGISTPMAPDEYPDFAFSWLQGGYEPSLSVWGHRFGDFMVERAIEALQLLDDPTTAVDAALPAQYTPFLTATFDIDPSPAADVGTVVEDVTQATRLEPVEFAWVGGDPGVEMPQAPLVTLERDDGTGNFVPLTRENFRPYDNREPVMITRVRRNADRWEWVVYWEETKNFPTGDYRFRVAGHHGMERTPYEAFSSVFTMQSAQILATQSVANDTLTGTLAYPAAPPLEVVGDDTDPGRVTGSFRMRSPDVPTGQPDPVLASDVADISITVRDAGGATIGTIDAADITVSTTTTVPPTTTFEADVSGFTGATFEVAVTDAWGNATP